MKAIKLEALLGMPVRLTGKMDYLISDFHGYGEKGMTCRLTKIVKVHNDDFDPGYVVTLNYMEFDEKNKNLETADYFSNDFDKNRSLMTASQKGDVEKVDDVWISEKDASIPSKLFFFGPIQGKDYIDYLENQAIEILGIAKSIPEDVSGIKTPDDFVGKKVILNEAFFTEEAHTSWYAMPGMAFTVSAAESDPAYSVTHGPDGSFGGDVDGWDVSFDGREFQKFNKMFEYNFESMKIFPRRAHNGIEYIWIPESVLKNFANAITILSPERAELIRRFEESDMDSYAKFLERIIDPKLAPEQEIAPIKP